MQMPLYCNCRDLKVWDYAICSFSCWMSNAQGSSTIVLMPIRMLRSPGRPDKSHPNDYWAPLCRYHPVGSHVYGLGKSAIKELGKGRPEGYVWLMVYRIYWVLERQQQNDYVFRGGKNLLRRFPGGGGGHYIFVEGCLVGSVENKEEWDESHSGLTEAHCWL